MNLGKLSFGCAEIVQQGLKKQTSAITDLISDLQRQRPWLCLERGWLEDRRARRARKSSMSLSKLQLKGQARPRGLGALLQLPFCLHLLQREERRCSVGVVVSPPRLQLPCLAELSWDRRPKQRLRWLRL